MFFFFRITRPKFEQLIPHYQSLIGVQDNPYFTRTIECMNFPKCGFRSMCIFLMPSFRFYGALMSIKPTFWKFRSISSNCMYEVCNETHGNMESIRFK